jgi:multidrug efflux pump subunit AcrA (membrane-fusion protein)
MATRRKFLKNAGILSAILALNPLKAEEILPKNKKIRKPVVLSTWRFGIQANEEAWKVLSQGGKALDAVFGASEGKQMYVWVVKDNKAYKREVTVHAPTGEAQVIISQGLKPGEEIIIAGVNQLVEGESVKVMKD